jgi:hypothetical protein
MVDFKEECTKCIHHKTCKYSEDYNKRYTEISNYNNDLEKISGYDECVITLTCIHYRTLSREGGIR